MRFYQLTSEWRPIETAPKDGSPIVVGGGEFSDDYGETWYTSHASVEVAYWYPEEDAFIGEYVYYHPAYWMPMPPGWEKGAP